MSDYVYDCADAEPCTVWREEKVVARKRHACEECRHPILPGEVYARTTCLFEGTWETRKVCRCCDAARCAVAEAYSRGEFAACIVPGELWTVVEDGIRDGWLTRDQVERPVVRT